MEFCLEPMLAEDWPAVRRIHQEGIDTGHATFEIRPASRWEEFDAAHVPDCSFVARHGAEVIGWAALSPVSDRCAYAGVAEGSVYVARGHLRKGVGSALLARLIDASEAAGVWTMQAGIFPENEGSRALLARHGFREVGVRRRLGRMRVGPETGRWRDVLMLERRSEVVGTD